MTIDLTGSVPQVIHTCDHCGSSSALYRLIGTSVALCRECFTRTHG